MRGVVSYWLLAVGCVLGAGCELVGPAGPDPVQLAIEEDLARLAAEAALALPQERAIQRDEGQRAEKQERGQQAGANAPGPITAPPTPSPQPPTPTLAPPRSLEEAREQGRQLGRPVLVWLEMDHCTPCQWQKVHVHSRPEYQELLAQCVVYRANLSRNRRYWASRYGINSAPVTMVFAPDGRSIVGGDLRVASAQIERLRAWLTEFGGTER